MRRQRFKKALKAYWQLLIDTSWFRKAKRRQQFKWFYDLKFYLQLKYITLRRNGSKN